MSYSWGGSQSSAERKYCCSETKDAMSVFCYWYPTHLYFKRPKELTLVKHNRLSFITISAHEAHDISRALLALGLVSPDAEADLLLPLNQQGYMPRACHDQQAANHAHSRGSRPTCLHSGCFTSFHVTGESFLPNRTWWPCHNSLWHPMLVLRLTKHSRIPA